jgi:sugar phosphate isomerase/epimerase
MKFGIEAGPLTLELACTHGARGVPIQAQELAEKGAEAVMAPLRERGLQAAQIGAFGFNPLHPDAAVVAAQTAILARAIELAPETGCRTIVLSCGSHRAAAYGAADKRNWTAEAVARYAEAVRPLLEAAEGRGVVLSVEAHIKGVVRNADSFLQLARLAPSPALRCNLDVTSLYGLDDLIDPMPLWRETCAKLNGRIGLVHVKEVAMAEGFHIHAGLAPLGSGPTDWKEALSLIAASAPADCWLLLEHLQNAEEAASSVALLRRMSALAGIALE